MPNFAAGGVATPADAALMMHLGADGVFVGSGIFKSGDPAKRAKAIVEAVANYKDFKLIAKLSEDLGEAMVGINEEEIEVIWQTGEYNNIHGSLPLEEHGIICIYFSVLICIEATISILLGTPNQLLKRLWGCATVILINPRQD